MLSVFFYYFFSTKEFLRNGILENDFMKNLEIKQINAIVNCMHPIEYEKNSLIIEEGDVGNMVYILEGKKNNLNGQVQNYTATY
jgi:cGMP-dependent protein kinase